MRPSLTRSRLPLQIVMVNAMNVLKTLGLLAACLFAACARSAPPAPASSPVSPPAVQPAPSPADMLIPVSPARVSATTLANFQTDLPAVDGPFECSGPEAVGQSGLGRQLLPPDAVLYSAFFPNHSETRATVVVIADGAGRLIRYAERRGPPIRPAVPPGQESRATPAEVAAAAAAVRSTMITMDYGGGRATVANRGGGQSDQMVSGPIVVVGSMERFGKPAERAVRVLAECAK